MQPDERAVERIARVVHEVNRAMQDDHGDEMPSQPWHAEDGHIRQLTMDGVRRALAGPALTPRRSHEAWCEAKRAAGWVYGPEKDPILKTHPCLRPYGDLPAYQQAKDRVFLAIVRELA